MDPQTAWLSLLDALEAGHWRAVRHQAHDLLNWLEQGGFPPNVSSRNVTGRCWNRQIAIYACKLARRIARRQLRR